MQLFNLDTGELVYQYTRKQAIEDGYQMRLGDPPPDATELEKLEYKELAEMARQVYKWPVFLTHGVVTLIDQAVSDPKHCNDWKGVLWDILWMSAKASQPLTESLSKFKVIITGTGRKRYHEMLVQCGPIDIDDPAPCLTIMLPEDY